MRRLEGLGVVEVGCCHGPNLFSLSTSSLTCLHGAIVHHSTRMQSVEHRPTIIRMRPKRFQKMLSSFSKKNNFFVQQLEAIGRYWRRWC